MAAYDIFIMVSYVLAVLFFGKLELIPYFALFLLSTAVMFFYYYLELDPYQVHLIYLIIFSYSAPYYKNDLFKMVLCLVMVLLQGTMAADAYLNESSKTYLYSIYSIAIGVIHIAFISSSFWVFGVRKHIECDTDNLFSPKSSKDNTAIS